MATSSWQTAAGVRVLTGKNVKFGEESHRESSPSEHFKAIMGGIFFYRAGKNKFNPYFNYRLQTPTLNITGLVGPRGE